MKWIVDELGRLAAELKRKETWIGIGVISLFTVLAFLIVSFAFRTDSVLLYLHHSVVACREMTNGTIIFLFCCMMFLMFFIVLTLGELQRYFNFRDMQANRDAEQALKGGLIWGGVAIATAMAMLIFFNMYCR